MNKKLILIISLGGLMSLFLFSSSLGVVNAAAGDKGVDFVEEGTRMFEMTMSTVVNTRTYRGTDTYESTTSMAMNMRINMTITEVNSSTEEIDYISTGMGSPSAGTATNTSELSFSLSWVDADDDNYFEDLELSSMSMSPVIAGTWEDYVGALDDLEQELEWAKGNVSTLDYSLIINDAGQKVTISLEFQIEDKPWSGDEESVIYDGEIYYMIDYSDFFATKWEMRESITLNSIVNQTYLEDNTESIILSSTEKMTSGPISSEDSGIPGYELFALLGVSCVSVFGIAYAVKRKKLVNLGGNAHE